MQSTTHVQQPSTTTPQVTVVDALMGAGKTTLAIRMMDNIARSWEALYEDGQHRFIYITPFLAEVARVKCRLAEGAGENLAADPQPRSKTGESQGRKLNHLNDLIREGKNIVATHSLFALVDEHTENALEGYQYTLMIDEVADWVNKYDNITKTDLQILYGQNILSVEEKTRRVIWTDPEGGYAGKFEELRGLCKQQKVVASRFGKEGAPALLLWQFPVSMLGRFKEVFIFTHLFEGSDMAAYLRLHGVSVRMATVDGDHVQVPFDSDLAKERIATVRSLVTIVEDRSLNDVGTRKGRANPLSVSWYARDAADKGKNIQRLQKATYNFFHNKARTKGKENLWSTFSAYRNRLKGGGYARGFLSCNARSTNEYRQCCSLAYLVNLYHHPYIRGYFEDAGIRINEDYFALLTMTQWIWRSQIRDGKPITVFVPSERMRGLLVNWLNGKLPDKPMDSRLTNEPDTMETKEAALPELDPAEEDVSDTEAAVFA